MSNETKTEPKFIVEVVDSNSWFYTGFGFSLHKSEAKKLSESLAKVVSDYYRNPANGTERRVFVYQVT